MCGSCWSKPTTKDAFRLSIASLVITLIAALWGISYFARLGSSLCLVYGLENCVDFLSSVVVLWRFFAPTTVDETLERKLRQREQRASVAISGILVLLGLFVLGAAIADYAQGAEDVAELNLRWVRALSFLSLFVFGILSALKFRYSNRLDSPSLYKDGICSLIGTV